MSGEVIIPIQLKHGLKAAYETANEPLLYGEIAIVYDGVKPKIKVGNSAQARFNDLPYFGGGPTIGDEVGGGIANSILIVDVDGKLAQTNDLRLNSITQYDGSGIISFKTANGAYNHRMSLDGQFWRFKTIGSHDAINIDGGSNKVGIFQPNPNYTLDVWGEVNSSGGYYLGGNADFISASSNSGFLDLKVHANSGVQTWSGAQRITKFSKGESTFYSYTYAGQQGGIQIYDFGADIGGWSAKGIKGINPAVWSGSKGIVFYEHDEGIYFYSPVSFNSQVGVPGMIWLGGSPYNSGYSSVIVSSGSGYVDFVGMKYATGPYPTVRHSAKSFEFYAKASAAWPDAPTLNGKYGTKILEIQDTGVNVTGNIRLTGNIVAGNNHYFAFRNFANTADINVLFIDVNDDFQALGSWQFSGLMRVDNITNRGASVMQVGPLGVQSVALRTDNTNRLIVDPTGKITLTSLPISSSGLSAGMIWNDAGILKIV